MTLLVARQCRLLRAPRGAVGALRRPAASTPIATAARKSHYTAARSSHDAQPSATTLTIRNESGNSAAKQKATPAAKPPKARHPATPTWENSDIVAVDSATLIPASVAAAQPQHFIDKIEPVDPSLIDKRNLVVFLVTPAFAPWLLDDSVFLTKALDQLYKDVDGPTPTIHAICAVFDKLPAARPFSGDTLHQAALDNRAQSPPTNETGFEGIAYVTLPAKAELSAPQQMGGDLGCIDFIAHARTTAKAKLDDRVRVPLANTVFQTGQLSTMFRSTWKRESKESDFHMRTRKACKTAVINLSAAPKLNRLLQTYLHQEISALGIPLIPLTLPRKVDGHMGNIVRGVIGPDGNKITASTELEQAVPQYFTSRDQQAQATSAWALVIPRKRARMMDYKTRQLLLSDHRTIADGGKTGSPESLDESEEVEVPQEVWQQFWRRDPPLWNTSIQKALAFGARLHKVLSGGGGWGKKAGLLSLDPVPFGAPVPSKASSNENVADDFDSVDDFSTALKPVVEDGDYIQFFISPVASQVEDASTFEHLKALEDPASGRVWSWEFGVVPSTVDSIPGGSWQHTAAAKGEMAVLRGSFGALTEGGLTLMHGSRPVQHSGVTQNIRTSTVDVPFSRWSAIRMFPKKELQARKEGGDFIRSDLIRNPDAGDPS